MTSWSLDSLAIRKNVSGDLDTPSHAESQSVEEKILMQMWWSDHMYRLMSVILLPLKLIRR